VCCGVALRFRLRVVERLGLRVWRNADELVDQLVSITGLVKKRLHYPS
jgi:hypothetical protein